MAGVLVRKRTLDRKTDLRQDGWGRVASGTEDPFTGKWLVILGERIRSRAYR